MIAVDTNILVHAHRRDSPQFSRAYRSMEALCANDETWAIPWPCLHEFLAVVTAARAFRPPTPLAAAIDQVHSWLASPSLLVLAETPSHWTVLERLIRSLAISGGAVHDARIAAICIEHGVRELWTADRDFVGYPDLATFNPLEADAVHEPRPGYAAAHRVRAAGRRRALRARAGEPASAP